MPKFTKLSADELKKKTHTPLTGERAKVRLQYQGYLKGLKAGEGGELKLGKGEKKVTVKNRLKRAAEDLDVQLRFRRTDAQTVRFEVEKAT